jgi:hypothetical protein
MSILLKACKFRSLEGLNRLALEACAQAPEASFDTGAARPAQDERGKLAVVRGSMAVLASPAVLR